mmetsp:Transcript_30361/g.29849  ORF Transcript_30361/g.29849 Transcript_30361/m.29849 type:complete len:105 (-) Transcript_30361:20-334(-)
MPKQSSLYIYGNMDTGSIFSFSNKELLSSRKTIAGISLSDFFENMGDELQHYYDIVSHDITEGEYIFKTEVVCTHPLEEFDKAIEESHKISSTGKVVLKPWEQS